MTDPITPDPQKTENPQPEVTKTSEIAKPEVQDDVPEKFKGKSAGEIAKSYLELEKTLGTKAKNEKEAREQVQQWEQLGKVIESNPALYKQVEDEITRSASKTSPTTTPKRDDTRIALENQIITRFEEERGIQGLEGEKKQQLHSRIGEELKDMLDPGGTKTVNEVLSNIPLDRLPRYLNNAYKLATAGDKDEQARAEAILEARQNREAVFGAIPSSGIKGKTKTLTPDQQRVARRMNMSEEDYLKQLEEIEKEK
jgi:hypothetical protein